MIEGVKTVMRQLELGDEVLLHQWRNYADGNQYCGLPYGFLLSKEAFRLEIKKQIEETQVFPSEKTFIICKKEDLKPIGDISYRNWNARNRSAEFGIEIGEMGEQSKGYGADALTHFINFMFNHLNLNRIELTTLKDNAKAQKLYKKLGFHQSGIMREASFDSRTGTFIDVVYMDILREEWCMKEE